MNTMKRILASLLFIVLLVGSVVSAQAQSLTTVYDFKGKNFTPATVIAEKRIADDLFGQKWFDVDALALAGITANPNRKTVGSIMGALAIQPRLGDDRIYGQLGVVGRISAGMPIATGFLIGIKIKF